MTTRRRRLLPLALTLLLGVAAVAGAPKAKPRTFATPEEAGRALIAAAETFDVPALTEILGADGVDLVVTADAVQDKAQSLNFAAAAHVKTEIVKDPADSRTATLVVGDDAWPMPIPIVEKGGSWSFDTKAGRQELLFRRVGENELDAIAICRGFVEAQHEYALEIHDGSSVNQYAQRIVSTPGKRDGLAWRNADGTWEGPVGEGIARVIAEGYASRYEPYHGYYFKVLKGQGPSAPLGAIDFVIEGAMIGGFALAAAPSDYGLSGVKSFIVSHDGVVFERDLGKKTAEWFRTVERFDPDAKWSPVLDEE